MNEDFGTRLAQVLKRNGLTAWKFSRRLDQKEGSIVKRWCEGSDSPNQRGLRNLLAELPETEDRLWLLTGQPSATVRAKPDIPPDNPRVTFGQRLDILCLRFGFRNTDVSRITGLAKANVSKYRCETSEPSLKTTYKLLRLFPAEYRVWLVTGRPR